MKNLNEIADWLESGKYQCLPPHTQKVNGYITTLRRLAEKPPNIFDRVMAEEPTVKLKDLYTSKPYGASLKIKEILVEEGADDRLPLDLNELDASIFNCVVDDLLSVPPFEEMFPDLCGFTMKSLHELDVIIFNEGEKPSCICGGETDSILLEETYCGRQQHKCLSCGYEFFADFDYIYNKHHYRYNDDQMHESHMNF